MKHEASELLIAALSAIGGEIWRVTHNAGDIRNPMANSGHCFKCKTFEANAYDWAELDTPDDVEIPEQINFKWRDIQVSWYKCIGRGTYVNREITPDEIAEMLNDCLAACRNWEKENSKDRLPY